MKIAELDFVLVPGLGNSEEGHWQRRWQKKLPNTIWTEQKDWNHPNSDDWLEALQAAISKATRPVVLVGHSLGNHAIAQAAPDLKNTAVRGALLVAPPQLDHPDVPEAVAPFRPATRDPLPFPSLVILADNDPYCTVEAGSEMAAAWGSEFHVTPEAGHINVESGHGLWPDGMMMLARLLKRV